MNYLGALERVNLDFAGYGVIVECPGDGNLIGDFGNKRFAVQWNFLKLGAETEL
jgi:hypothetical protein